MEWMGHVIHCRAGSLDDLCVLLRHVISDRMKQCCRFWGKHEWKLTTLSEWVSFVCLRWWIYRTAVPVAVASSATLRWRLWILYSEILCRESGGFVALLILRLWPRVLFWVWLAIISLLLCTTKHAGLNQGMWLVEPPLCSYTSMEFRIQATMWLNSMLSWKVHTTSYILYGTFQFGIYTQVDTFMLHYFGFSNSDVLDWGIIIYTNVYDCDFCERYLSGDLCRFVLKIGIYTVIVSMIVTNTYLKQF